MTNINLSREGLLSDAATHLRVAIELLDRAGAPGQIGARIDHALCELDELVPLSGPLEANAEMHFGASVRRA